MLSIQRPANQQGCYYVIQGTPKRIDQKYPFEFMELGDRLYLYNHEVPGYLGTVRQIAAKKGRDVSFTPVRGGLYIRCVGRV